MNRFSLEIMPISLTFKPGYFSFPASSTEIPNNLIRYNTVLQKKTVPKLLLKRPFFIEAFQRSDHGSYFSYLAYTNLLSVPVWLPV